MCDHKYPQLNTQYVKNETAHVAWNKLTDSHIEAYQMDLSILLDSLPDGDLKCNIRLYNQLDSHRVC